MMWVLKTIWPFVTIVGVLFSIAGPMTQAEVSSHSAVSPTSSKPERCEVDITCQGGQFCSPETKTCIPCIKCKDHYRQVNLNRANRKLPRCIRESRDCGPCLEGYHDRQGVCTDAVQLTTKTVAVAENATNFILTVIAIVCRAAAAVPPIVFGVIVWEIWKNVQDQVAQTQETTDGMELNDPSGSYRPNAETQPKGLVQWVLEAHGAPTPELNLRDVRNRFVSDLWRFAG